MAVKTDHDRGLIHVEPNPNLKEGETVQEESLDQTEAQPNGSRDACNRSAGHNTPCIYELTHLLRLEKYQSQRSRQLQQQLFVRHVRAARSARLHQLSRSIQCTLAECIQAEDKQSFVNLFNAFNDAITECTPWPADVSVEQDSTESQASKGYHKSFLDSLPHSSQSTLLGFLKLVRNDGDFLAGRLASLSHKDLISLLPDKNVSRSDNSVFGSSPRSSIRTSKHLGFVIDGQTDLISSSAYASPIETLIHSVRDVSSCTLEDDDIATDVWATVCAKLISDQRPGSERLVPAILDQWAFSSPWAGNERFEIWLSQILQKGSVLLDQVQKQSFRVRIQARPESTTQDEDRLETFFTTAVNTLLGLLTDMSGASIIPSGALKLCSAIFRKLQYSTRHQQLFPNFVVTRWLFPHFIPDALFLPEMHGMLSDHFISDVARQRIFREIASRCQKAVFDVTYAWKYGGFANEATTRLVHLLTDRFRSSTSSSHGCAAPRNATATERRFKDNTFVAISSADMCTLADALYPTHDPAKAGLRSSSSSISGFSIFQGNGAVDSALYEPIGPTSEIVDRSERLTIGETDIATATAAAPSKDHSYVIEEDLREARIAVEEISSCRRPESPLQWCILTQPAANDASFATVHQQLLCTLPASVEGRADSTLAVSCKTCRAIIEALLEDGTLIDGTGEYGKLQNGSKLLNHICEVLESQTKQLEAKGHFVEAHACFSKLKHIEKASAESEHPCNVVSSLANLHLEKQAFLRTSLAVIERCDDLLRSAKGVLHSESRRLLGHATATEHLRNKMWYVADVRVSSLYDEVRAVSNALKSMGRRSQAARTRSSTISRNWTVNRTSSTVLQSKTEAQVLDIISAPPDRGGRNKLSDEQAKAVLSWVEFHVAENFCRGEERLHKFCMEVRKAVDQLTAEGSALMSSALFARDAFRQPRSFLADRHAPISASNANAKSLDMLALQTNIGSSHDVMSNRSSHALSTRSSRDYLESWSPSTTNRSSVTFWSPATTDLRSPSSVTSIGSSRTQSAQLFTTEQQLAHPEKQRNPHDELRQYITSLILSDVGIPLFGDGSETDMSFGAGIGGELFEKYLTSINPEASQEMVVNPPSRFNFHRAFKELTQRFSASTNPSKKLKRLSEIDVLLGSYCSDKLSRMTAPHDDTDPHAVDQRASLNTTDRKVEAFKFLFCSSATRPEAIFRDLQYIAALLPSSVLQTGPQSKAFWNAAAAISSLKRGACNLMVETADSIIAHYSNDRGRGRSSSAAQRERDSATFPVPDSAALLEDVGQRSMSDAATLLQITAREGYRVAQRELATLYLTHPELMEHVIAPFSRPREVFKEELENKWRRNQDPARCDPATMCVAHHWMSLSSKGGDALATEFLRQREEMDRLP